MAIKSSDQVSVLDITDGYGTILTSEAYTLIGDTAHALAATVTTQVMAYLGANAVSVNVGTITCPSGITAAITDNNTNTPTITFTVAGGVVASACEASIPYTVDGKATYTKKFSFAVALKGTTGSTGAPGGKWYAGTGVTGTATTGTVFSGSGVASANVGDMYLNTTTYNTYICLVGGAATVATWSYKTNIQGGPGADAIYIDITSSNGTIFKNTSIATVLTAHVYVAGVELDSTAIAALGTLKWYKDGGSTAVGTGATLTITAGDVTNKAVYTVQLEG